jgi:hypothetical protein
MVNRLNETEDHALQLSEAQAKLAAANVFVAQAKAREAMILSNQKVIASALESKLQSKRSELEYLKEKFALFRAGFEVARATLEADHIRLTEIEPHMSIDTEIARMEPDISIDTELAGMEPENSIDTELASMAALSCGIDALDLAIRESESAELVSEPCPRLCSSEESALVRQSTDTAKRLGIWERSWIKVAESAVPPPASGTSEPDSSEPEAAPPAKPAPSNVCALMFDEQSVQVQNKMSRIQVNLEEVYGRESCDNPPSHPKVIALNRSLAKLQKRLRAINMMRYNMRQG